MKHCDTTVYKGLNNATVILAVRTLEVVRVISKKKLVLTYDILI
jgi:hypothetical protein